MLRICKGRGYPWYRFDQQREFHQTFSTDFEMNRLSAAILPVSHCTSLMLVGGPMSRMALILAGLASIPRWVTTNPRNCPPLTLNAHFPKLSFNRSLLSLPHGGVPPYFLRAYHPRCLVELKYFVHQRLVGGSCVFQPEGHGYITECAV
ncbi:UNVERIFIED_CONTAM: hypothetical protein Sradi_1534700 [Sesamum radiatum]|uniref:Uncharacterized protein n=1 Tax=Sesamum radiatum TaxID=300843 RepID=A0AAW2U8U2_SESRA